MGNDNNQTGDGNGAAVPTADPVVKPEPVVSGDTTTKPASEPKAGDDVASAATAPDPAPMGGVTPPPAADPVVPPTEDKPEGGDTSGGTTPPAQAV